MYARRPVSFANVRHVRDPTTNHSASIALISRRTLPRDSRWLCGGPRRTWKIFTLTRAEKLQQSLGFVVVSVRETMPVALTYIRSTMGIEKKSSYEAIMLLIQLRLFLFVNAENRCAFWRSMVAEDWSNSSHVRPQWNLATTGQAKVRVKNNSIDSQSSSMLIDLTMSVFCFVFVILTGRCDWQMPWQAVLTVTIAIGIACSIERLLSSPRVWHD